MSGDAWQRLEREVKAARTRVRDIANAHGWFGEGQHD